MRIAYIAPFEQDYGTEVHLARAFLELGHHVICQAELDVNNIGYDISFDPDLVLYTKGSIGLPERATEWWRKFEDQGIKTASFHLDLYRGIARGNRVTIQDPFWSTGTVFTADGDPETEAWMADRGVNHHWLPPAVAHDETHEGQWRAEYDHDVVFVGSGNYHREWPWRQTLIRTLARKYGPRFKHYDHHPPIRGNDLNDLYATARVVVGDSLALPGHRNYFSDRYFETVGRGGFLIAPNVPGIEDFFTEEHLAFYDIGDTDGLIDKIDWYLGHPAHTKRIAAAGQAHVRKNHTYIQRVEQMFSVLGLAVAA